jgi:hypothetical protein
MRCGDATGNSLTRANGCRKGELHLVKSLEASVLAHLRSRFVNDVQQSEVWKDCWAAQQGATGLSPHHKCFRVETYIRCNKTLSVCFLDT